MASRYRVTAVLILVLQLSLGVASTAQAKGWLPSCWQRFWHSTQRAANPVEASSVTTSSAATCGWCPKWLTCAGWAECSRQWSKGRRQPKYGLGPIPPQATQSDCQTLVVYLHGLNSRPEDLLGLMREAADAGFACTSYRYPNDQPIQRSAQDLSSELKQLARKRPHLGVVLVSHSMGGLVARAAIESPDLDPRNVRRLIMIAPPNQGSYLAQYACGLDAWEFCTSTVRRKEAGLIAGSIVDGLAEATQDLRPGSEFLRQLNQRSRHPRVRYSLVIGTAGPLPPDDFARVQRLLSLAGRRCSWMAFTDRHFRERVLAAEELFAGKGDGLVSLDRAQLDGVDDVIVGKFSHGGILADAEDPEVRRVRAAILQRL